jgi:small-conductance mechanosensitive channel
MRKNLTILAALICLACLGYLAQTWRAISQARQEHAMLEKQNKEAQQLTEQNQSIAKLREQVTGMDALKKENAELPKLRNEARQLRRKVEELDQLRNENQRLLAAQRRSTAAPPGAALPAGFISKDSMADVGLGSPEAAAQTLLWATSRGAVERAVQCLLNPPPDLSPNVKEELRAKMKSEMEKFPGFVITEKKLIKDDEVEMSIQASPGGATPKLLLKRIGNEWKLKEGL